MSLRLCSRAPLMRMCSSTVIHSHCMDRSEGSLRGAKGIQNRLDRSIFAAVEDPTRGAWKQMAATDTVAGYELEGSLLEVCTCNVLCPCWIGEDPDGGDCLSVV